MKLYVVLLDEDCVPQLRPVPLDVDDLQEAIELCSIHFGLWRIEDRAGRIWASNFGAEDVET